MFFTQTKARAKRVLCKSDQLSHTGQSQTHIEEISTFLHDVRVSNELHMRTLHFDPSPYMLEHSSRKEPFSASLDVVVENVRAVLDQDACGKPDAATCVRWIGPSGISCASHSCYCNKFPRFPQLHERASLSKSVLEEWASIAEAGSAQSSSGS